MSLRNRSAGFQTCRIADFQIGCASDVLRGAGLETGDTANSEVCATVKLQAPPSFCRLVGRGSRRAFLLGNGSAGASPYRPSVSAEIRFIVSAVAFAALLFAAPPLRSAGLQPAATWPGAELFTNGAVEQIEVRIEESGVSSLRESPRQYVRSFVKEGGTSYTNVAVHLKGSIGSFREIDDKPALTLDFAMFNEDQRFHSLRRIYLNNSVEDPSYCNELLGGELFRAAGIPAPRVGHAVVTLNGRRLGLFVLKEGFTEDFLRCYFDHIGGDLYEPGEGHDVNQRLKRNAVQAPTHGRAALEALADAALEADATKRWSRLEPVLDVDEFIRFMAMEVMVGHRDGYSLAKNNYRVYYDAQSDKIVFFPHGMDQLFGNANSSWLPHMAGLVAKAVMETPEGKTRYRETFGILFTNVFHAAQLERQVDETVAALRPVLTSPEFSGVKGEAAHLKERILLRESSLRRQLSEPERAPLAFTNDIARLDQWTKADEAKSVELEVCEGPNHKAALHILARSASGASWRTHVLLERGHYRFKANVKVAGVKPLEFGKYQGAGLRVAGNVRQSADLIGDSDWRTLSEEFEVTNETQEVELVCELRASAGDAWFEKESLKVIK